MLLTAVSRALSMSGVKFEELSSSDKETERLVEAEAVSEFGDGQSVLGVGEIDKDGRGEGVPWTN